MILGCFKRKLRKSTGLFIQKLVDEYKYPDKYPPAFQTGQLAGVRKGRKWEDEEGHFHDLNRGAARMLTRQFFC